MEIKKNITKGKTSNKNGLITIGITAVALLANMFVPDNEFSTYITTHAAEIATLGTIIGGLFGILGKK